MGFYQNWQVPFCCGAVDGKHCVINCPNKSGSTYFNYKGTFSIVLMAIADANYRFVLTNIGAPGRISDGGAFERSQFPTFLKNTLPKERVYLPGTNLEANHFIVGDPQWFPNLITIAPLSWCIL